MTDFEESNMKVNQKLNEVLDKLNSREVKENKLKVNVEGISQIIDTMQKVVEGFKKITTPILDIAKTWYDSLPDDVKKELESNIEVDKTETKYKKYKVKE